MCLLGTLDAWHERELTFCGFEFAEIFLLRLALV